METVKLGAFQTRSGYVMSMVLMACASSERFKRIMATLVLYAGNTRILILLLIFSDNFCLALLCVCVAFDDEARRRAD